MLGTLFGFRQPYSMLDKLSSGRKFVPETVRKELLDVRSEANRHDDSESGTSILYV